MFVGAVLDVAVLDAGHLVGVLFGEDLAVLDGLDGGVVVVLVDLTVDGFGLLVELGASYMLVLDGGVDGLGSISCCSSVDGRQLTSCTVVSCFPSLERKFPMVAFALSIVIVLCVRFLGCDEGYFVMGSLM